MQITQEKIDEKNALLKIKVEPTDYNDRYSEALKRARKQVQMPGFRPGKIPMGVIKSRYGKSLLAEEMNEMLNQSIQSYIAEQDLKILGSPMPKEDHVDNGNWDNPGDFEFVYELGLAPKLDVEISNKTKLNYYTIKIDKKLVDDEVNRIARRYGKVEDVEKAGDNDMLVGDFVELDNNGEVVPGGVMNQSTVSLEFIDKDQAKKFFGLKIGDELNVQPSLLAKDNDDLGRMLGLTGDALASSGDNYKFIVREVKHMEAAELNEEFFKKTFGEDGEVKTEKDFREKVSSDLGKHFVSDSDRLFKRDISKEMIAKYNPDLPDEFLKRWIRLTNENPISAEEVERDYAEYRKSLQWQLIFNELVSQDAIKVSQDDVVEKTKELLVGNYAQYGMPAPEDKELEESAKRVLGNQEEARKIYDMLYDEKLITYVKENASVSDKEVSFDKFVELASEA
ncbi:trigger factor [Cryomorphaceae bacterium 1068]|nr:trigger factor [Cryomorphaceae bacterium 1068]